MISRIGLRPRLPGLSTARFQELWAEHSQYAKTVPGRLGYVQNFAVLTDGRYLLPHPGFDTCTETVYASVEAMDTAFRTSQSELSLADHEKFVDSSVSSHFIGYRRVPMPGRPPEACVKLFTFMRAHPAARGPGFTETLAGDYARAIAEIRPIRHEQVFGIDDRGPSEAPCDGVDIIWFAGPADALRFVGSEAAERAALTLTGRVFGRERLIARPVVHIDLADAL